MNDDERVLCQSFLFFCVDESTNISGLRTKNEDILATNGREVVRCFDGSDVGMSSLSIDAFIFMGPSQILISVSRPFSVDKDHALPGLSGEVDDSDILLFQANRLGEITRGIFSLYFDGSDVGLDTDDEDVDALAIDSGGLVISTVGDFESDDVSGKDEDLIRFDPTKLGHHTDGQWKLYFDGSKARLSTSSGEDVDGAAIHPGGRMFLTTREEFSIGDVTGKGDDILQLTTDDGKADPETARNYIRGNTLQLHPDSVSAIDLPQWRLSGNLISTHSTYR